MQLQEKFTSVHLIFGVVVLGPVVHPAPAVDQDVVRLVGPGVPVVQDESLTVGLKKLLVKIDI